MRQDNARSSRDKGGMVSIELLALDRIAWQQVAEDPVLFARQRALTLGAEVDLFRSVGRQTVAMLQRTSSIGSVDRLSRD